MAKPSCFTTEKFVPAAVATVTLPLVINIWLSAVSGRVGHPYLDEVFHVGQAEKYCDGKFREWDPKITTPPGLYLLSYLASQVFGFCGLTALRALNAALILFIFLTVCYMSSTFRSNALRSSGSLSSRIFVADPQQIHTALNVCLFPPLFFFSGLYYTDVGSTLFVLLFFKHFLDIHSQGCPSFFQSSCSVMLGLSALMFRQTNIFWVAVFPAGLLVVDGIAETRKPSKDTRPSCYTALGELQSFYRRIWTDGIPHDPQVTGAWFDDYILATSSIIILAVRILVAPVRLFRLIRVILPYVLLLAIFAGFVVWNGGVVLGDKSNHVATLHLPQMLYIWPYMTFFSVPLTYPYIIQAALALVAMVPVAMIFEPLLIFRRQRFLPRPVITISLICLAMLVVRNNTIIHPFTLADNRHYTFYAFRILLRHPAVRYLVVPIYMVCAWSVIQTLGAPATILFVNENAARDTRKKGQDHDILASVGPASSVRLNDASFGEGCKVSYVLVWLITSTLALVTAPLVEPRYFIIPWVMWRLRVPQAHPGAGELHPRQRQVADLRQENTAVKSAARALTRALWLEHDHRLWLETGWFLAINAITGWIFLNKGFVWPQEPANVQRFMW